MVKNILIKEENKKGSVNSNFLTSLLSFSERRTGIYTLLERIEIEHKNATVFYENSDKVFSEMFLSRNKKCQEYKGQLIDLEIKKDDQQLPWNLIYNIKKQISSDFLLFKQNNKSSDSSYAGKISILGSNDDIVIHPTVTIYPGVVFDTRQGPIIIDERVMILPFSNIKGPVYIGKDTKLLNSKISEGVIIGNNCIIEGEVVHSIIGNYNHFHSSSTINFSVSGDWIRFGSFAGASNLKLDYGNINFISEDMKVVQTPYNKVGAILSDFSSIPDKSVTNPGTTIDFGTALDLTRYSGYYEPFLNNKLHLKFSLNDFLGRVTHIMSQKGKTLIESEQKYIKSIYEINL